MEDADGQTYRVRGTYFEACNCEAICPCRMVAGVAGGRSTYGVCFGALSWRIDSGLVGDVDVSGLGVALVMRYDDDEVGSPWTLVLHVDENGTPEQRDALAKLFLGELGGPHVSTLPWIRKHREVVDVRTSAIEVSTDGVGGRLRVGGAVRIRATSPVEGQAAVSCIVPGYDRIGTELTAEEHTVDDVPFSWELGGRCAFLADFDYESA